MTGSMRLVIDMLKNEPLDITPGDLYFILTVIRDNVVNDDTEKILDKIVKEAKP